EKGNQTGLITVLEDERREVRRQLRQAKQREAGAEKEKSAASPETLEPSDIVRLAYLRTLGRLPDDREGDVARKYVSTSGERAKGLRALLWALLNTKEFITNH